MEQFSLEKYLENPSRKITTRYGDREVRIICTDRKGKYPIVALMVDTDDGSEYITSHSINGWIDGKEKYPDKRDLFFVDEKEELTEFEKELQIIISEASHWTSDDGSISTYCQFGDKEIKKISAQILDLARKEIEKSNVIVDKDKYIKICDCYYEQGKKDALKNLPKWYKGHDGESLYETSIIWVHQETKTLATAGLRLDSNTSYLPISELEKLPKEE